MKRIMTIVMGLALLACGTAFAQDQSTLAPTAKNVFYLSTGSFSQWPVQWPLVTGPSIKGAPYSAETTTETTQTLEDGTHIDNKSSYKIYRDSEGRTRREGEKDVWISDPVAGVSYILHPGTQTVQKMSLGVWTVDSAKMKGPDGKAGGLFVSSSAEANAALSVAGTVKIIAPNQTFVGDRNVLLIAKSPDTTKKEAKSPKTAKKEAKPPKTTKKETLGTREIDGVQAEGTRETTVIPAGEIGNDRPINIVSEQWYSPDLKIDVMTRHSDPRTGETVTKLEGIQRGEQDPSLFQVPPIYTIKEPGKK